MYSSLFLSIIAFISHFITTNASPVTTTLGRSTSVDVSNGAIAETENGILNGGVTVSNSVAGYSGTGYVQGFTASADSVTLTLYSTKQALYNIVVRYGAKQTTMSLNGGGGGEVVLANTSKAAGPWANATAGQLLLNAGSNILSFADNWGYYLIDCVYVTPSSGTRSHNISSVLVAPNPLPVTQALFNKLLSKYGSGDIFSGQSGLTDIAWLEANVGQTPAIFGLDMMDYSPSRVAYGASSTDVENALAFDARGGFVAFQWHWNAPADLINNATVKWWSGFYTYATTFNLAAALADTSSTNYALLLSYMDAIAKQLLRLQAANIPVLWRPLHEAEGGWFWWGASGPEACKTLYHLMFQRFTQVHGLRNLIWIWNSVSATWYPGADVVDMLGYDSYPQIGDHGPVSVQYQQLIALGNDQKMVTLPEVGNIPDPGQLKAYHADWSYFVTWNGNFIETDTNNPLAFKRQVYDDPTVLKLSDLGNWKGTTTTKSASSQASLMSTTTSQFSSSSSLPSPTFSGSSATSSHSSSTFTSPAAAPTQTQYGQCGGTGWTGVTVCATGTTCKSVAPPWYYQCL